MSLKVYMFHAGFIPSEVYRAYIFPTHWAGSSNFRAICSRVRATSVCLRFRTILSRTGDLSQVYKFITPVRLPFELVERDVKLIFREKPR